MTEDLKEIITKNFSDEVRFDYSDWDVILDNASNISVFYSKININYYVEYFKGMNLSFVLYENNCAVGLFPMIVYQKDGLWVLSTDGTNLIKPLFIDNIARKTKKRLERKIIKTVYEISIELKIDRIKVFEFDDKLSTWYLLWLNNANKFFATHHLIVDLKLSLEEIRLGFRKSYKPLVNKALREYDITVCQENIGCLFEEFRLLHLHVAGKQTRSLKSWKVQQELIENNEAFLVTVRDHGTLVGAGFFTYTRDIGSYSVGVYKRELHDKPIGHGVQIKAIEYLKSKGCKKYYIGQKMTPLDENPPTDKEISISHFKEGFASLVQVHPHLEIKV